MHPAPYGYRTDPAVPGFADDRPIIVFDGHCALCTGWVRFVMARDTERRFRFLPAQSPLGRALYVHYGLDPDDLDTNILLDGGRAWFKLEAAIRIAEGLGLPWSGATALRILPKAWQEPLYDAVARKRFALYGRETICHRPEPGDMDRFLA